MSNTLVWFRNDLRLHDNEVLSKASEKGKILPLYIFDPRTFSSTANGFSKTGPIRAKFLIDTIKELKKQFQNRGADLLIKVGNTENVISEIVKNYEINHIYAQKEITKEETDIELLVSETIRIPLTLIWGSTLYHINDIPYEIETLPDVFTNFRKQTEKESSVRALIQSEDKFYVVENIESSIAPQLNELGLEEIEMDARTAFVGMGGELEALKRVKEFIWEKNLISNYKETRNGLLGTDYSTKFSPWLANGSLSPRQIFWEIQNYENERITNQSTYWLVFELLWRDFFRFSALKYGSKIFYLNGIKDKKRTWSKNIELFNKWAEAKTGIPFIDANMRELNLTGYMSNRGRQNVASFLAQNLNIDWRMGAEWFESKLIDYDPCLNYGNWAYNATVGHDPRNRYFNILNQAERYDPNNYYVKYWLPELSNIPDDFIQKPHELSDSDQDKYGVKIGFDYPAPIIDLDESYKEIRQRG